MQTYWMFVCICMAQQLVCLPASCASMTDHWNMQFVSNHDDGDRHPLPSSSDKFSTLCSSKSLENKYPVHSRSNKTKEGKMIYQHFFWIEVHLFVMVKKKKKRQVNAHCTTAAVASIQTHGPGYNTNALYVHIHNNIGELLQNEWDRFVLCLRLHKKISLGIKYLPSINQNFVFPKRSIIIFLFHCFMWARICVWVCARAHS